MELLRIPKIFTVIAVMNLHASDEITRIHLLSLGLPQFLMIFVFSNLNDSVDSVFL